MARIENGVLRNWNNGETIDEAAYEQEREILRVALNDNYDRIIKKYDKEEVDALVNNVKDNVYTKTETYAKGELDLLQLTKNKQTFTATEGQTVFTLSNGSYTVNENRLWVYVGGVIQASGLGYAESSSTSFTLSEGVPAGTIVYAEWLEAVIPYQVGVGHSQTHEEGGQDEIDFTKLKNYNVITEHMAENAIDAHNASNISIADTESHFTATNVEGALDELFTSANSVKTNVSGAIGLPATVNDTGSQLAGYITTEKGRIASNMGDGSSADTLKYLVDRLGIRLDELATNVNTKGVTATSADTLTQLVTKVSQISTGKKSASGTVTSSASTLTFILGNNSSYGSYFVQVTGLDFIPSVIHLIEVNTGAITYMTVYNNGVMLPDYNTTISMNMVHSNTNVPFNPIGFRLDGVEAYTSSTGFRLPVKGASKSYKWYAFE
jgi:hypothetical protein